MPIERRKCCAVWRAVFEVIGWQRSILNAGVGQKLHENQYSISYGRNLNLNKQNNCCY
ncbi:MAG: hypothetical protein LBH59_08970 [Planctomycetaceae bacterium]|nr:hypothetical protein [Planctomycetaceae bacterium]